MKPAEWLKMSKEILIERAAVQENKVLFWARTNIPDRQILVVRGEELKNSYIEHNAAVREMVEKGELTQDEAKFYLLREGKI